jgi:hypothetical protein
MKRNILFLEASSAHLREAGVAANQFRVNSEALFQRPRGSVFFRRSNPNHNLIIPRALTGRVFQTTAKANRKDEFETNHLLIK